MHRTIIVIVFAVVIVATGVYVWLTRGPLAFSGGSTVALADYHEANPTGVPADLAKADIVTRGEYEPELAAIACGVFGPGDELVGVICLTGPQTRFQRRSAQAMGDTLLDACQGLTALLGGDLRHYAPRKPAKTTARRTNAKPASAKQ